jgi:hypothetical protein
MKEPPAGYEQSEIQAAGYDGVEWRVARIPEEFSAARPSREALRHNLGFVRDLMQRVPARS